MKALTIAIDGPSGAGKGTVARRVAAALGYRHLDTGAMYRALGWLAVRKGVPFGDENALASLAEAAGYEVGGGRIAIGGHEVAALIRTPEIDQAAAAVARWPRVREVLVARQRRLGEGGGVVVEGRDIGTVVFPEADVKIYLDATPEERARRRASDPAHAGGSAGVATVANRLAERDRIDTTRTHSPLTAAPDAVVIDTTALGVDEVVDRALALVRARMPNSE